MPRWEMSNWFSLWAPMTTHEFVYEYQYSGRASPVGGPKSPSFVIPWRRIHCSICAAQSLLPATRNAHGTL